MELYPFQAKAIEAVRQTWRGGKKSVLLVLPTGGGKTACASVIMQRAHKNKTRSLFVVSGREIVLDTASRLTNSGVSCGVIMAGVPERFEAPVQVASVETLLARGIAPPAGLIVWDEAHHAAAETYTRIRSVYPDSFHLGLTATPERGDGATLGDAFDEIVVGATIADLIALKRLKAPLCFAARNAVKTGSLSADPVGALAEIRPDARGVLCFCSTIAHAQEVTDRFNASGVRAALVTGKTKKAERGEIVMAFRRGEIRVLCNVDVFTEGFDAPRCDTVILARSVGNQGLYLQMAGRALRADAEEPDRQAYIIDCGNTVSEFGPPDAAREFSLEGEAIKTRQTYLLWLCQTCGACRKAGETSCWRCGWKFPEPAKIPKIEGQSLELVTTVSAEESAALAKRRAWFAIAGLARKRGHSYLWACYVYSSRFGGPPDTSYAKGW